jgi:PA14 domain
MLTGTPVTERCETAVNYDGGGGSPSGAGVGPDSFSVRWVAIRSFAATGSYTFTATADDGIRVYLDGTLVIDQWKDQSATTYTASRQVTAGSHEVKVEYYENGGDAVAKVAVTP